MKASRFDQDLNVVPSLATEVERRLLGNQMDSRSYAKAYAFTTAPHSMRKRSWIPSTGCLILIAAWQQPAECALSSSG